MRFALIPLLTVFPFVVCAQPILPPISCDSAQNWHLDLFGNFARLRQNDVTIADFKASPAKTPENQDWPKAVALQNGEAQALALLDKEQCTLPGGTYPLSVTMWVPTGNAPALRLGCCSVVE